ncbi:hypothetical protein H0H93_006208 [Arthromyces matolae]|nr:hypothetical protein H0H93_006208 [Arthromyces matolae]
MTRSDMNLPEPSASESTTERKSLSQRQRSHSEPSLKDLRVIQESEHSIEVPIPAESSATLKPTSSFEPLLGTRSSEEVV